MQVARHMATPELDKIYQMIDSLSDREKRLLFNYVSSSIQSTSESDDSTDEQVGFTEEEIKEMLAPKPALTGREIVEKHLKSGEIGSWADMGITDSVEWLQEQRAKRRNKFQW